MATSMYSSMENAMTALQDDAEGRQAIHIVKSMMENESQFFPKSSSRPSPVVVVEGLDGVGKSTLIENLKKELGQATTCMKSPPQELSLLREAFDKKRKDMRRAFYVLGNYACALKIKQLACGGPVVVDRFWPSTVAYAIAHDHEQMPDEMPGLLEMPKNLIDLLPQGSPIIFLLMELSEAERARRVRSRASEMPAGFNFITPEEEQLERSSDHRTRLTTAYHTLRIDGQPLTVCDASGTQDEVLVRAMRLIENKIKEHTCIVPTSVNWHFTRVCNYACKFCFHTAKNGFFLPKTPEGMEESKLCLTKLRDAGMKKLNFSGGEPFLQAKELGELCRFLKEDLRLESVSIVSNGSKIRKPWLQKFGCHVDILAISCDSFDESTNKLIGRGEGMHLDQLEKVRDWCTEFAIPFKLNSVINVHNVDEDMTAAITRLKPVRWKVFQCLLLNGENAGDGALRDAKALVITDEAFDRFVERHQGLSCIVPESNKNMKDSYLILDEELCFLNCTGGKKTPSRSIREIPVWEALQEAGFDKETFIKRGGVYNWSRPSKEENVDMEDLGTSTRSKSTEDEQVENQEEKMPFPMNIKSHLAVILAMSVGGIIFASVFRKMARFRA